MEWTIRNVLAACRAEFFILSGKVAKRKQFIQQNNYILSIYFHNPTRETFRKCVKWLINENYSFLSIDKLLQFNILPFDNGEKYVIITVDDGWRDNYSNIYPIAVEYKVPITIFISTDPVKEGNRFWWSYIKQAKIQGIKVTNVENLKKIPNEDRLAEVEFIKKKVLNKREALNIEEINEIADNSLITFGSHTISHPILTQCSLCQLTHEIDDSKSILEQILLKTVDSFSYPNGDYTDREVEIVKNAGYKIAFGTKPNYINKNQVNQLYTLPRFEILDNVSFSENLCRMTGVWFNNNK